MDPYTQAVLWATSVAWAVWGTWMAVDVLPLAWSPGWRAFLIALSGPAVWGLALWWGWQAVRRRILHRMGLTDGGCCGNH